MHRFTSDGGRAEEEKRVDLPDEFKDADDAARAARVGAVGQGGSGRYAAPPPPPAETARLHDSWHRPGDSPYGAPGSDRVGRGLSPGRGAAAAAAGYGAGDDHGAQLVTASSDAARRARELERERAAGGWLRADDLTAHLQPAVDGSEVVNELLTEADADLADLLREHEGGRSYWADPYLRGPPFCPAMVTAGEMHPLPPALQRLHAQVHCTMGLLPEIHRAYVTFDNKVFLWHFDHVEDFTSYERLDQVVLSVGLVMPTPVVQGYIEYLLVVATTVEVVLLGVSFETERNPASRLTLTPLRLSFPTDNVSMLAIAGTSAGRIFLGGADGCLYELIYEDDRGGWRDMLGLSRGAKCRKVNHTSPWGSVARAVVGSLWKNAGEPIVAVEVDHYRNLLYTLAQDGTISLFDLGQHGDELVARGTVTLDDMRHGTKGKPMGPKLEPPVSISVIPPTESERLHLVAITSVGARMYFTTMRYKDYRAAGTHAVPFGVDLVHIANRHPPSKVPEAVPNRRRREAALRQAAAADPFGSGALVGAGGAGGAAARSSDRRGRSDIDDDSAVTDALSRQILPLADDGLKAHDDGRLAVHSAAHIRGVMLLGTVNEATGEDTAVAICHDPMLHGSSSSDDGIGPNRLTMQESVNTIVAPGYEPLSGKIYALAEAMPNSSFGRVELYSMCGRRQEDIFDPEASDSDSDGMDDGFAFGDEDEGDGLAALHADDPADEEGRRIAKRRRHTRSDGAVHAAARHTTRRERRSTRFRFHSVRLAPARGGRGNGAPPPRILGELATQHEDALQREFLCLTSHGLYRLLKMRPIDQLSRILSEAATRGGGLTGRAGSPLDRFFRFFTLAEACCMCIVLACTPDVSTMRARASGDRDGVGGRDARGVAAAVFRNVVAAPGARHGRAGSPMARVRKAAIEALDIYGGNPVIAENVVTASGEGLGTTFAPSGFFDGCSLYLARLLRPVWQWPILMFSPLDSRRRRRSGAAAAAGGAGGSSAPDPRILHPHRRFNSEELRRVAEPLAAFRRFLAEQCPDVPELTDEDFEHFRQQQQLRAEAASSRSGSRMRPGSRGRGDDRRGGSRSAAHDDDPAIDVPAEDPDETEKMWIGRMYRLVDRCVQALSLLAVLCMPDHNLPRLLEELPAKSVRELQSLKFHELVTFPKGTMLVRALLGELLRSYAYGGRRDLCDRLSNQLRDEAGDYFSQGDMLLFQAAQRLRQADKESSPQAVLRQLQDSVDKVRDAVRRWTSISEAERALPIIARLCRGYSSHTFERGVVWAALAAGYRLARGDVTTLPRAYEDAELADALQRHGTGERLIETLAERMGANGVDGQDRGARASGWLGMGGDVGGATGRDRGDEESSRGNTGADLRRRSVALRLRYYEIILEMLHFVATGQKEFRDPAAAGHLGGVGGVGAARRVRAGADGARAVLAADSAAAQPADTLTAVGQREREARFTQKLLLVLNSPDKLFLEVLYAWLYVTNRKDILVTLRSADLPDFLRLRCRDDDLLYRYYIHNNRFASAAHQKYELGTATVTPLERNPRIEERIEHLQCAVDRAREPSVRVGGGVRADELAQWELTLRQAKIQRNLLVALVRQREIIESTSPGDGALPESIRNKDMSKREEDERTLRYRLIQSLVSLYHDYGVEYLLHVPCLEMLDLHRDPADLAQVQRHWVALLDAEMRARDDGYAAFIKAMQSVVSRVGLQFCQPAAGGGGVHAGHPGGAAESWAFPLDFLVRWLERRAHDEASRAEDEARRPYVDPGWLFDKVLGGLGISWGRRYRAYSVLFREWRTGGQEPSLLLHLLRALYHLMRRWLEDVGSGEASHHEAAQLFDDEATLRRDAEEYATVLREQFASAAADQEGLAELDLSFGEWASRLTKLRSRRL